MGWADATGGDVSNYIDQAVNVGAIPAKVGSAVKNAVGTYQGYVNAQTQRENDAGLADEATQWANGKKVYPKGEQPK